MFGRRMTLTKVTKLWFCRHLDREVTFKVEWNGSEFWVQKTCLRRKLQKQNKGERVCGNNSFWDRARLLPMFGCCHWRHAAWCLDVEKTFYWSWNIEEMRDREQYHLFLFSFFTLFFTKKINWNVKKKCNSISARFMAAYSFFIFL